MGTWSWQRNPFVGTQPYQAARHPAAVQHHRLEGLEQHALSGLDRRTGGTLGVVRDPGGALGDTSRPLRASTAAERYEQSRFIAGTRNGFVEFGNTSSQPLFQHRIAAGAVRWAGGLLARLTDRQWRDAFRAGGYAPETADRFIRKIRANIEEAQAIGGADGR
jgi:hypothetical protein